MSQAATFNVVLPSSLQYESRFNIRTSTTDSNSNTNLGQYNRSISNYSIYDDSALVYKLQSQPTLTVSKYGNINTIPDDLAASFSDSSFTNLTGATIYEYQFSIPNFQNIPLDPTVPSPFGTDGTVKWYVPSKFTYAKSGSSFSIDLGDGKNQLLNSLKGFDTIFNKYRQVGLSQISFPTNTSTSFLSRQAIQADDISATAIPESNSSAGLIVLGLIGKLSAHQTKINS